MGDHVTLRDSTINGNKSAGGLWTSGNGPMVLFRNKIAENGDVNAQFDQDRHGIKVLSSNLWVLENELANNSGDGMQIGDLRSRDRVHHIYVARNVSHNNKQTGFWHKECHDVIFSQNVAYGHQRSNSSSGEGFGGQYDANFVWFLFNESRNNMGGICWKSSNNGKQNHDYYAIGNHIHDNINTRFDTNNVWQISAISSWNAADITIVNNTLQNNSGGINLNGNTGAAYIYNNVVQNVLAKTAPINTPDLRDVKFNGSNAFDGDATLDQGTAPISEKDPYAVFKSRYGVSIQFDRKGTPRPVRNWDIGAIEAAPKK